jgi:hypothetical protein
MYWVAASTSTLLDNETWETKLPGFTKHQTLRKFVKKEQQREYPHGKDWQGANSQTVCYFQMFRDFLWVCIAGVQWQCAEYEHKLPADKRYIHSVVVQNGIKIAVTMLQGIVKYIHDVSYLAIDFTFKRIHGETNELNVATFLERFHTRTMAYFTFALLKLIHNTRCYIGQFILQQSDPRGILSTLSRAVFSS